MRAKDVEQGSVLGGGEMNGKAKQMVESSQVRQKCLVRAGACRRTGGAESTLAARTGACSCEGGRRHY